MQTKPKNWPAEGTIEDVPEVLLEFEGQAWPPARGGHPDGVTPVGTWSVSRNLTGGGLPGQARGASGGSIAQADATFPQPANQPLSPFTSGLLSMTPGGHCMMKASHGSAELMLGSFQARTLSGASTSGHIEVELEESSQRMKRPFTHLWSYDSRFPLMDAAAVVEQAARLGGYLTTCAPVALARRRTVIDAPLGGSPLPAYGYPESQTGQLQWSSLHGRIGLAAGSVMFSPFDSDDLGALSSTLFYIEVAGTGGAVELLMGGVSMLVFRMNPATGITQVLDGDTVVGTLPVDYLTDQATPVLAFVERASATLLRIQISTGGPWSSPVVFTRSAMPAWSIASEQYKVAARAANGWIRSFVRYRASSNSQIVPADFRSVTAFVESTGSLLAGAFDAEGQSCWEVVQSIARATMGAAWLSETGALIVRNRASLRTGPAVDMVVSELQLESLPWSTSVDELADRVELTYTPVAVREEPSGSITLWEATEAAYVPPATAVTLIAEFNAATDRLSSFLPLWDTVTAGENGTRWSRWAAATSRDGGGERPADDAITVDATLLTPSKARLRIRNNSEQILWLVDSSGNPSLTLRTTLHVEPGEQETVSAGVSEEESITSFTFDTGSWVQDHATAREMLSWLTSQTGNAQPTIPSVRVKPDLARQLGDIVVLTDDSAALQSKALITNVVISGDASGYQQNLSFAILASTFQDLDEWCTRHDVSTFTHLDDVLAEAGVRSFEDLNRWLDRNLFS